MKKKGFTLLELIVVLFIMSIIIGIATSNRLKGQKYMEVFFATAALMAPEASDNSHIFLHIEFSLM